MPLPDRGYSSISGKAELYIPMLVCVKKMNADMPRKFILLFPERPGEYYQGRIEFQPSGQHAETERPFGDG